MHPTRLHVSLAPAEGIRLDLGSPFAGLESLGSVNGKAWIRAGVGLGVEGAWVGAVS